jgi:undecaprenyl-diphosphatase
MPYPADPRLLLWVVLAGTSLFVLLAVAVTAAGASNGWDRAVDAALRGHRTPALDDAMFAATYLCSWQVVVAGLVAGMAWLLISGWRLEAVALLVSVVGDQVIVSGLKRVFDRARPDQLLALLPATGPSFPSGHTFAAVAFYGALALLAARFVSIRGLRWGWGAATLIFVLVVGLSRIYLGAHWPSDVLGSWLLGSAWVSLVALMLDRFRSRFPRPERGAARDGASIAVLLFLAWLLFVVIFASTQPVAEKTRTVGAATAAADTLGLSARLLAW